MGNTPVLPSVPLTWISVLVAGGREVSVLAELEQTQRELLSEDFSVLAGQSGVRAAVDSEGGTVGLRVWPGALRLSRFLLRHPEFVENKIVLELGCGVGLPGLTVARFCNPTSVLLTDRASMGPVVSAAVEHNGVSGLAQFQPFDWGSAEDLQKYNQHTFDVVIGTELVYAEEQEPLANAFAALNADVFILCYTQRSDADKEYLENRLLPDFDLVEKQGSVFVMSRRVS